MEKADLAHGWERLQGIYTSLPALRPAVAEEWYKVLRGFSAEEYQLAIDEWIGNEKYKPVPSELAKYCWKARRMLERRQVEAEEEAGECPWCGGLGVVTQYEAIYHCGMYYDSAFPCQCRRSRNPELGRQILVEAQADSAWVFDRLCHGFRRRKTWVGEPDPRPATREEQAQLWQEAKKIGGIPC